MRIALLCHYFHPEIGAPSARLYSLAKDLSALGHEVTVVTGFPNHPTGVVPEEYRGRWMCEERLGDVRVLRNWLYATANEGFIRKTLGHLSFMASSILLGGPRLGSVDIIVVSSPTFFSVISAWFLSRIKRIPFVFEVRDLWPAIFVELGVLRNRWLIRTLEIIERFLYERSGAIVTVTETFQTALIARGILESKITTITNGVDTRQYTPGVADPSLRESLAAQGRSIVLYLGAHGISHGLEAILRAARRLAPRNDVLFLFVGEGAEKRKLLETASAWGLDNVRFLPGQPRETVLRFYRTADVCLVPLRDVPLFEGFIPSKMFEIMACAKPIIASVRGEAAQILGESGAALVVPPENDQAISEALIQLLDDAALRKAMGQRGRSFVESRFERSALARHYADVLERVAGGRS